MENRKDNQMKPKDQEREAKARNQTIKNTEDKIYVKKEPHYLNPAEKREKSEQPFDKNRRRSR